MRPYAMFTDGTCIHFVPIISKGVVKDRRNPLHLFFFWGWNVEQAHIYIYIYVYMYICIEAPQHSVSVVFSLRIVYVFRHLYVEEEEEEEEEEEGGDSLFYK